MTHPEFSAWPEDKPVILNNVTCVYCGSALVPSTATKEHVIAKRFVPVGKLHQNWNLIVRACRPCNNQKSDLEDDIAAITMAPDAAGRHAIDDAALKAEASRKSANSVSRRTRKPVAQSAEQINFKMPFGPAVFTADFTAPPQLDDQRVFHLARLQLSAFFYWVTYDTSTRAGRFWQQGCYLLEYTIRADWGNERMRGFADAVRTWEPRVLGITAEGFFKVIIRRHPNPMTALWAWALEWNHNYRIIGFFGDAAAAREINAALPKLKGMKTYPAPNGGFFSVRQHVELTEADDLLFEWDTGGLAT